MKIIRRDPGDRVSMPAHVWDRILSALDDNQVAWEGEEWSVREEHAELIEELESLDHCLTAHGGRDA